MNLVRLIYASRPNAEHIEEIVSQNDTFQKSNSDNGVTGVMVHSPTYYLQWIEGPRQAINQLYRNLMLDERHHSLEILDYQTIHVRQFPDWAMRSIAEKDIQESILMKYVFKGAFDPYEISGSGSVEFLKEVCGH